MSSPSAPVSLRSILQGSKVTARVTLLPSKFDDEFTLSREGRTSESTGGPQISRPPARADTQGSTRPGVDLLSELAIDPPTNLVDRSIWIDQSEGSILVNADSR